MLKYFLEALCGQEEPLLAFKGGKYVSVAPVPDTMGKEMGSQEGKQLEDEVLCGESPLWQRGRLPSPPPTPLCPWLPTRLFITTQSSMDVDVTSQLLKSALCWCPFLPVPPQCLHLPLLRVPDAAF